MAAWLRPSILKPPCLLDAYSSLPSLCPHLSMVDKVDKGDPSYHRVDERDDPCHQRLKTPIIWWTNDSSQDSCLEIADPSLLFDMFLAQYRAATGQRPRELLSNTTNFTTASISTTASIFGLSRVGLQFNKLAFFGISEMLSNDTEWEDEVLGLYGVWIAENWAIAISMWMLWN